MANSGSFIKGQVPWNKTAGVHINCGHCGVNFRIEPNQVGRKKFCSKSCFYKGRELKNLFEKGHPDLVPQESRGHSKETIEKLKIINRNNAKRGEVNPLWKGNRTERKVAMLRYEYKDWRKAVFERDDYTCQCCGVKGGYLEADHIKPWCAFPTLRYSLNNGRTLCKNCHIKQDTYGRKAMKYMKIKA